MRVELKCGEEIGAAFLNGNDNNISYELNRRTGEVLWNMGGFKK